MASAEVWKRKKAVPAGPGGSPPAKEAGQWQLAQTITRDDAELAKNIANGVAHQIEWGGDRTWETEIR